jgi:hypothetical protein
MNSYAATAPGSDRPDACARRTDGVANCLWSLCADPDAWWSLSFQISLLDMAVRDADLRAQLAGSIRVAAAAVALGHHKGVRATLEAELGAVRAKMARRNRPSTGT